MKRKIASLRIKLKYIIQYLVEHRSAAEIGREILKLKYTKVKGYKYSPNKFGALSLYQ
jgi:hypothetical protein